MVDKDTDFFQIVDNFTKTKNIESICIFESDLNFKPKITIAIPTFKRVDLLKEAIDSALNQVDYSDYDVIVVDNNPERDCETEKLMISYNDSRVSYYKNVENIQMTGNWNRLFSLAKGEFVVMLHDDDLILPNFLKECMFYVNREPDLGILKPLSESFSKSEKVHNLMQHKKNVNNSNKYKFERLYDISNYFNFSMGAPTGCLFNKKYVLKIGGFNQDFFPTMDLCFVSLFSTKYKVYKLNKILSLYRWGNNESLKITTLKGFIVNDYYYRHQLLKKYYLPNNFINHYISSLITRKMPMYSSMNAEFSFDLKELNLNPINRIPALIYVNFMRIYSKGLRISKNMQSLLDRT